MTNNAKTIPFGTVFGELTVLDRADNDGHGNVFYWTVCTCGMVAQVRASRLRLGGSKSCGKCRWEFRSPVEYVAWQSMRQRCNDTNGPRYKDYGGRGITICKEWESFARFLLDMGPKPFPEFSLDRKDNNKGYCKENCHWTTDSEQSKNRRYA